MRRIFEDIGGSLKIMARVLFTIGLLIGLITLAIGVLKFLNGVSEHTTVSFIEGLTCTLEDATRRESLYADCYYGRQIAKLGFALILSSFAVLPLYGLGELIDLCYSIDKKIKKDVQVNSPSKINF
jgi:hypothetical protein